jgi:hypothetical protein
VRRADLCELREYPALEVWDFLLIVRHEMAGLLQCGQSTGTASMTKSTSERSSREVLELILCRVAAASSLDILCLPTSFSKSLSANFKPLSMDA